MVTGRSRSWSPRTRKRDEHHIGPPGTRGGAESRPKESKNTLMPLDVARLTTAPARPPHPPKGTGPHRPACAQTWPVTHLTEQGVDRRFIQEAVGHWCDTSTAICTHVSGRRCGQPCHRRRPLLDGRSRGRSGEDGGTLGRSAHGPRTARCAGVANPKRARPQHRPDDPARTHDPKTPADP